MEIPERVSVLGRGQQRSRGDHFRRENADLGLLRENVDLGHLKDDFLAVTEERRTFGCEDACSLYSKDLERDPLHWRVLSLLK